METEAAQGEEVIMESTTEPESGPARIFPSGSPEPSLPRQIPWRHLVTTKGPSHCMSGSPRTAPAILLYSHVWGQLHTCLHEEEKEFGDLSPLVRRALFLSASEKPKNSLDFSPFLVSVS